MMRNFSLAGGVALLMATTSWLSAAELQSGIEVDGRIGTYRTTKVAGCADGVDAGKSLCYTWKLGGRPVVFIFAKTPNDALASLVSKLDKVAADNADARLSNVINFTGEVSDEYIEQIEKFGEKLDLQHTALTTTSDGGKFKINEDAEVTVMHYKGKKVGYNFSTKDELSEAQIKDIVKGTATVLE